MDMCHSRSQYLAVILTGSDWHVQEQGGDQAGALHTLRSALHWWRNSMVEPPQGGQHPEHWLLQVCRSLQPSDCTPTAALVWKRSQAAVTCWLMFRLNVCGPFSEVGSHSMHSCHHKC